MSQESAKPHNHIHTHELIEVGKPLDTTKSTDLAEDPLASLGEGHCTYGLAKALVGTGKIDALYAMVREVRATYYESGTKRPTDDQSIAFHGIQNIARAVHDVGHSSPEKVQIKNGYIYTQDDTICWTPAMLRTDKFKAAYQHFMTSFPDLAEKHGLDAQLPLHTAHVIDNASAPKGIQQL